MKRVLLITLLVILMALVFVVPASAHGPCESDGAGYGLDHIASHGPHGNEDHASDNGAGHNPGTHQGFSLCLGVH